MLVKYEMGKMLLVTENVQVFPKPLFSKEGFYGFK